MSENKENWEDLFDEIEKESGFKRQKESWEDIFGDDLPDTLMDELGLGNSPAGGAPREEVEEGDTFPIDEAFFKPESTELGDTNVIPKEVQDLSAYTAEGLEDDLPEETEEIEDDEDEAEEEAFREAGAIRRVRRRRTGLLGGLMYAAFILGVSTILGFLVWMAADEVLGLTAEEFTVEITIPEDFTIEDVANELHAQGLINNRFLFRFFATTFNYYDRIQPGVYQVSPVDYRALIGSLNQRTGEMIEVRVTIPEGRTVRQVFEALEEAGVATVESLEYAAENGSFDFDFLNVIPHNRMNRLEGYLFPDTYVFFLQQNPETVIRRMLRNFDERMRQHDIYDLVEESPFTLHEIVNIAAMIERETASIEEMPRIASVVWNRLDQGMHLGIDATIQYLLPEPMEFLTTAVINEHAASPYNTYHHLGLPYGPIANPGVAAILAALQPENTSFLFYALHIDGDRHHFTNSYGEHNAFLATPNFAHHPDNR